MAVASPAGPKWSKTDKCSKAHCRKMMAYANRPDGDERSKKIYQMIEVWLRNELRNAITSVT